MSLKTAAKILKETFQSSAAAPSKEKRLFDALRAVEATRKHLKTIAPVTESEDLRLACQSGPVESWSFDQYLGIRLAQKGWFAKDVTQALQKFRDAAQYGRFGFERFAEKVKDEKPAQFIFSRTGDLEALAKELKAMTPADMKDVPRNSFLA